MLPGIKVYDLKKTFDERGFFVEVFRSDWRDLLEGDAILQVSLSLSYPGVVKAWHRHAKGQVDYITILRGTIKICVYDDGLDSQTKGELDEIIASSESLQIVRIPGFYWHGTKAISNEPSLVLYFSNKLYNYQNPDEERRPWNDPSIVPKNINGKNDDMRCNKPWDWFHYHFR